MGNSVDFSIVTTAVQAATLAYLDARQQFAAAGDKFVALRSSFRAASESANRGPTDFVTAYEEITEFPTLIDLRTAANDRLTTFKSMQKAWGAISPADRNGLVPPPQNAAIDTLVTLGFDIGIHPSHTVFARLS